MALIIDENFIVGCIFWPNDKSLCFVIVLNWTHISIFVLALINFAIIFLYFLFFCYIISHLPIFSFSLYLNFSLHQIASLDCISSSMASCLHWTINTLYWLISILLYTCCCIRMGELVFSFWLWGSEMPSRFSSVCTLLH